jgi:hypothetical protein
MFSLTVSRESGTPFWSTCPVFPYPGILFPDQVAVHDDFAFVMVQKCTYHVYGGALSGAVGSREREEPILSGAERDIVHGKGVPVALPSPVTLVIPRM